MLFQLIKRLIVLKTMQAIRMTAAPIGASLFRLIAGTGLIGLALLSGALSGLLFLLALFIQLAHLLYRDPVLWVASAALLLSAICLLSGSLTLKSRSR